MTLRIALSRAIVAFVLCCVVLHGRSGVAQEVLRNEDVAKMAASGLGDEIIVAKVQEAAEVDFALAVDDLIALRKAGVSERVIHAMLERSKPAPPPPRPMPPPAPAAPPSNGIALQSGGGAVPLHMAIGEVSGAGFGPFTNVFMNYPGLQSPVRVRDRRPALLVTCPTAPEVGHYFFAKLDPDRRHQVRSLKIGKAIRRIGQPGGRLAPDADWVLPFDVKEETPGTWRVTVQHDLEPGEYGLYINLDTTPMGNAPIEGYNTSDPQQSCFQGGTIFAFGID
jgi:hypothetical protein